LSRSIPGHEESTEGHVSTNSTMTQTKPSQGI